MSKKIGKKKRAKIKRPEKPLKINNPTGFDDTIEKIAKAPVTKTLDHGIKASKQGADVKGQGVESLAAGAKDKAKLPHLLYALALPYLAGAKTQVQRYREVTPQLKTNSLYAVQVCLHEVSCLFEDLVTVSKYAEMCGNTHELHSLWLDVRNHIRHDFREELDVETDERKNKRATRLKLNIGFDEQHIKVGGTIITLKQIEDYLAWAEDIVARVLNEAFEKGWITGAPPPIATTASKH